MNLGDIEDKVQLLHKTVKSSMKVAHMLADDLETDIEIAGVNGIHGDGIRAKKELLFDAAHILVLAEHALKCLITEEI